MKKNEIKKIRFDKVCDDWLAYKKPIIKESTYLNYAFTIKKRFEKDFENKTIDYRYTYKKILHDCLINYKNFHCLRHTFATRCIRVGMDVKSLSEILGHSNVSITLEIYVHSSFEIKKKFIDKL